MIKETGEYESRLKVYQECTVRAVDGGRRPPGALYERESGRCFVLEAPVRRHRHRRYGQVVQGDVGTTWEYTGDGHALALLAGAPLLDVGARAVPSDGGPSPPVVEGRSG